MRLNQIHETYTTRDQVPILVQVDSAGRIYTPQTVLSAEDEMGLSVVKQRVVAQIQAINREAK